MKKDAVPDLAAVREELDRWRAARLCAGLLLIRGAEAAQSPSSHQHRIIPLKPMTEDVEILYGDPEKVGEPFVMRIRELPGGIIPPHRHPVDEHITVLQGTLYFAVSDRFDRAELKELKPGSYAFIPKGSTMFGYIPEAAIVQVHGIGPFHIEWRDGDQWRDSYKTLDSPDAAANFKPPASKCAASPDIATTSRPAARCKHVLLVPRIDHLPSSRRQPPQPGPSVTRTEPSP